MNKVSINPEQQRYVVDCGVGYSCLGFANARDHANQIAHKLGRPDLAFAEAITPRSPVTKSTATPSRPGAGPR